MKKILLIILFLSFINFDIYGESYTIPLTYNVSPTYTVSVPQIVDISNEETSFTFSVSGDIYYDYELQVLFADTATITNGKYSSIVNVSQEKDSFSYEDLNNNISSSVNLIHDSLNSGYWTGELKILITLIEGAHSQWKTH